MDAKTITKYLLAYAIMGSIFGSCNIPQTIADLLTPVPEVEYCLTEEAPTSFELATSFSCENILIDASHGGTSWWHPQLPETGFVPCEDHEGKKFARFLRESGFRVDEVPRGHQITDELLQNYYIIFRTSGFRAYDDTELQAYSNALADGKALIMIAEHREDSTEDKLATTTGLNYHGYVNGELRDFTEHDLTAGIYRFEIVKGSEIIDVPPDMDVLGTMYDRPVMGVMPFSNSKVLFLSDIYVLKKVQQPFIQNLINWMLQCPFR